MKEELNRSIGVWGLSANIVNIIIGAGIFALPAIIAGRMGASSIYAYLACGVLIALSTLCFAEAGSKVTITGGSYTYMETAFGPYVGFLGGIFALGSALFADAAVSNALVNVLATVSPFFGDTMGRLLAMGILFFGLATINVLGVKQGIGLVKFNTVAKLTPLLLLIILGWKDVSWENLTLGPFPEWANLGATSLILFFAFQGCETGLIVGGEVENPKKNVPKAIAISIAGVLVIYIAIQTICQGVLGSSLPEHTAAPLAETARVVLGPTGYVILTLGASISMLGFLSGSILNNPRMLYALGRDRVLPIPALARIHNRFTTPYLAIWVYALLGFTIAATGSFERLVIIGSSSLLIIYFGVALSVIKLRYKMPDAEGFKIPGGIVVPILAASIIVYFLSQLPKNEMLGTLILIPILSLIYFGMRWLKKWRGTH